MKRLITCASGKRSWLMAAAAVVSQIVVGQASSQIITLTDNNSVALVDVGSQAGMFYWGVQGQNQLQQQWFWYGIGNGPVHSIDTISPASASPFDGTRGLATTYANAGFNITINYLLTGGSVLPVGQSSVSDIGETIKIVNTTGGVLPFHFYQYSHFNLGGASSDTVQLGMNLHGLYNEAVQQNPLVALTETVTTPGAPEGEVAPLGLTLAKLNGGGPVTLGPPNGAGPVGPGAVTWALEWDFNLAPGGSALISKDKYLSVLVVPEPSSMALLLAGAGFWVATRRYRARDSARGARA